MFCPPLCALQVRGDSKTSSRTRLTFCTTGVLLRRLLREPDLAGVTHIVVDEIHGEQQCISSRFESPPII